MNALSPLCDSRPLCKAMSGPHPWRIHLSGLVMFLVVAVTAGGHCFAGQDGDAVHSQSLRSAEDVSPRPESAPSRLGEFSLGAADDYFTLTARRDQARRVRHRLQKTVRRAVRRLALPVAGRRPRFRSVDPTAR
jgi:hypothetical protein